MKYIFYAFMEMAHKLNNILKNERKNTRYSNQLCFIPILLHTMESDLKFIMKLCLMLENNLLFHFKLIFRETCVFDILH